MSRSNSVSTQLIDSTFVSDLAEPSIVSIPTAHAAYAIILLAIWALRHHHKGADPIPLTIPTESHHGQA